MKTLDEIREEIENTIGMHVIINAVDTMIVNEKISVARNLAASIAIQLDQNTTLSPIEIYTAVLTIIMDKMYDWHTNIHKMIPAEIIDAVDIVLNP